MMDEWFAPSSEFVRTSFLFILQNLDYSKVQTVQSFFDFFISYPMHVILQNGKILVEDGRLLLFTSRINMLLHMINTHNENAKTAEVRYYDLKDFPEKGIAIDCDTVQYTITGKTAANLVSDVIKHKNKTRQFNIDTGRNILNEFSKKYRSILPAGQYPSAVREAIKAYGGTIKYEDTIGIDRISGKSSKTESKGIIYTYAGICTSTIPGKLFIYDDIMHFEIIEGDLILTVRGEVQVPLHLYKDSERINEVLNTLMSSLKSIMIV